MRVTLIGGSGFVGTRLIELLSDSDAYEISNIDLLASDFFNEITHIGDVRNQKQMDELLKGSDLIILLAAKHRDDVYPTSEYYDTNVGGMRVCLNAMEKNGVKNIIFFSSVAVYGLNKNNPDENFPKDPFNHYGKSKWEAEKLLQDWYLDHPNWNITIIRPTVIFGERNRGNVYNLLKQIASGKFLMVGSGSNKKSMAYVGNVTAFVKFIIEQRQTGYHIYNYSDKPDYSMNDCVELIKKVMGINIPSIHIPYFLGMLGGYFFDILAKLTCKKLAISSVRVKKFCATTQFDASKLEDIGFVAPYSLESALTRTVEFEFKQQDNGSSECKTK